jgi:hypothetical protein
VRKQPEFDLHFTFDSFLSLEQVSEQALKLVQQYLPELLKEMIWQSSEQEN